MKLLLVVLDGAADRPCRVLNDKTPLDAALTKNLDNLTSESILWKARIAGRIAPESDVGVLSLLGISPFKKHYGRAIFEWLSTGKKFENGWLAMRANFATIDEKGKILDRRAGRSLSRFEAKLLEREINAIQVSVPFKFIHTYGHRGVIAFKGDFSKHIQNTDPAYQKTKQGISNAVQNPKLEIMRCTAIKKDEKTNRTAKIVNEFTQKVILALKNSTINVHRKKRFQLVANALLLRDGETKIPTANYNNWTIVASMPLEIGIGKAFGMRVIKLPEGNYKRAAAVVNNAVKKRNVYVHLKGPDNYGHDGQPFGKKKSIEKIDREFFGSLKIDWKKTRMIVTADHATPCNLKAHSNDAVPVLVVGMGIKGTKNCFDEKSAATKKEIAAHNLLKMARASVLRA